MRADENKTPTAADPNANFANLDMASMLEWITANAQKQRAFQAMEKGDYDEARQLLEPEAARGSIYSLLTLGGFYEWGKLGPVDMNVAISYYERAASEGSAEAHQRLGRVFYDTGDEKRAQSAFKHGAEAGNISCMYWLGKMKVNGRGGGADVTRGIEWLTAAAGQGHIFAKRDLLILQRKQTSSIFKKILIQVQIIVFVKELVKEVWKDNCSDKVQ